MRRWTLPLVASLVIAAATNAQVAPPPVAGLADTAPILGGDHDPSIKSPRDMLGFEVGDQAATHAEIERCFKEWDASPRAQLVEYARSHENRPLYYMVISSEANIRNLNSIKADLARIADPRNNADTDGLARSTPAVAWLAYSIHGDETSGADAAIAVAYHLIASRDDEVRDMLNNLLIIIDPMMNPDGRDRFLKMVREHRGNVPNVDDQSLLHTGYWPAGRTNHYMFDLNRDWIFGVHPETRGRIKAVGEWNPVLFVDAHEMGSQDTYLFSPPRAPINPNFPQRRDHWNAMFAREQAAAFDANGWRYYTGEWNEGWYPGYSDAWAAHRGAVGILYEQAGVAHNGVLQANGGVLTYKRSVRQQATSSIANIRTLLQHHTQLMEEFAAERRNNVADRGTPFADRAWAIIPDTNTTRLERFTDLMHLQGIEVHSAEAFRASGKDTFGRAINNIQFPDGTLIIRGAQPDAPLVSTMLGFDPRMDDEFLADERREILKKGQSKLYDVTTWNIPMMFGLDAYELTAGAPARLDPFEAPASRSTPVGAADVAWVVDGADDDTAMLAAQLMERGVEVRIATKPITWAAHSFSRGSVVVTIDDNRQFSGDLRRIVQDSSRPLGLDAIAVNTGLGEGELPDLGGENFVLLERPRVALVSRDSVNSYDAGAIWHELDYRMGLPLSVLDEDSVSFMDLRRYNTIIVPAAWGESPVTKMGEALKQWVDAGGTLIAIDSSAAAVATSDSNLGSVRQLSDVLDDLSAYELALLREHAGRDPQIDHDRVWSMSPSDVSYPWQFGDDFPALPDAEELKRRDTWQSNFMPQGAFIAARVDPEHWLTFGCRDELPVLMGENPVLMAAPPAEAPIRLGIYEDADTDAPSRVGWGVVPAGKSLRMRMSGLLWPEASQRLANAAWVTRERIGSGQVILFASSPTFRGATPAMTRVLRNAVIYGPGFGASHPITR
ncbi:MAG: hypothetical protein KDA16_03525 [Phycisphaerales bacterium]|nr:hypothetical protein [Phycisphaerales bacterium]